MMHGNRAHLVVFCLCSWAAILLSRHLAPWLPPAALLFAPVILHALSIRIGSRGQVPVQPPPPSYRPPVSIVIPAHNEIAVIAATVENMLSLEYPDFEVIVVDDRSTDGTAAALAPLLARFPGRLRCFSRPQDAFPGKSAALNDAFRLCRGDVLCVVDADARVAPDFLVRAVPFLAAERTGAVQIRMVYRNAGVNTVTRILNSELLLDAYFSEARGCRRDVELRGCCEVLRRAAIEEIGGWDDRALADDVDLSLRLLMAGWDIGFTSDITVSVVAVSTVGALLRQRWRWTEGPVRTYLTCLPAVFGAPMSLARKIDILVFSSGGMILFWFGSDLLIQAIRGLAGYEHAAGASLALFPVFVLFFAANGVLGVRRYGGLSWPSAAARALECALVMVVLWTVMVFFAVFRILFLPARLVWMKSRHDEGTGAP